MLITHILIGIVSVIVTTLAFFFPSHRLLKGSYGLIALTITTGTYLVVALHVSLLHTCLTGLFYVAALSLLIAGARHKLSTRSVNV